MNKSVLSFLIILSLFNVNLPKSASAQVAAERVLPTQGYLPEHSFIVEITVQAELGEYTIRETPPAGWAVSRINQKGKYENGVIQWAITVTMAKPPLLSYWLTVPVDAGENYECTGTINDQPITGDTSIEPHSTAGTVEHRWIDSVFLKNASQVSKRELTVYLPEEYGKGEKRYPVLYLMHGYTGTNRTFFGNGYPGNFINEIYIDSIADSLIADGSIPPMIIVLPDLNRQIPLTAPLTHAYKQYLLEEVIGFVDRTYRTIPKRESRIIAGHSSGGNDAVEMAIGYPTHFSLVGIYSAGLMVLKLDTSLFAHHDQQINLLRFWITAGRKDPFNSSLSLLSNTRTFVGILDELGLPYEYVEDDSDHFNMIEQKLRESIKYFSKYVVYDQSISSVKKWYLLE